MATAIAAAAALIGVVGQDSEHLQQPALQEGAAVTRALQQQRRVAAVGGRHDGVLQLCVHRAERVLLRAAEAEGMRQALPVRARARARVWVWVRVREAEGLRQAL
jgi:hypothetical protein